MTNMHQSERNWLIEELQRFAQRRRIRVSIISGDVHCAAVGVLKTLGKGNNSVSPSMDHRYMNNVVTSDPPYVPYSSVILTPRTL